jgi:hypothetical protein
MANENQNTGPQNIDPRNLRQGLRDVLEDQGDYNNLLKDSIRYVDSLDKTYAKISARINALNKDTINVKQLNQELQRLAQKQFIAEKNRKDILNEISEEAKAIVNTAKQSAKNEKEVLTILQAQGNLEAVSLYTAEQAVKFAEQQLEIGRAELDNEKSVSRQLGISGNLMKLLAEKINLGEEAYSAMTIKARNLVEEQKSMNIVSRVFSRIVGGFQVAFTGLGAIVKSAFSYLLDPAAILGGVGLLMRGLKAAFDFIVGIQDKTVKFARAMNLSTEQARQLKMQFASLSISSGDLFITSQKMVESQMELVEALGVTNRLSNEQLATNIKLKDITGLDLETRRGIVEVSTITGQESDKITKSILAQVVGLKAATGVSFSYQRILKEASNLGGYLGLSFAKYPAQLTKSLLTVKAMGMELKQLDSLADSFLDFESSISREFEAQLLTGKDINLAKAREAFLNNDLVTAASEITRQVGSASDFLKLNRIQAESLAGAFGMSRDQMAEMLKQQELLSKLGAKQGDSAKEQLRLGLERYKNQKALTAAIGEEAYQSLVNASSQEKIAAFMDKIKQAVADFVSNSPLIPLVEKAINWLSSPTNIQKVVSYVQSAFATLFDIFGKISGGVMRLLNYLPGVDIDQSLIDMVERGGESIRAMNLSGATPANVGETALSTTVNQSANQIPAAGNSMSMAKAPEVYVLVNVDPITGLKTQKVITKDIYERQFGPMANQYK